jgi:excinuclease ABC subunit C
MSSIFLDVRRPRAAAQIRADVRERAENRPGVYRMVAPDGALLYVGKSVRVRARVLSYFRAAPCEKAAEIIAHTHHVEWEYVPSEFAAVLHEMRLIREHRPPFNVQHKRERAFCFIKLTREAAPRMLIVFEVKDDGAAYFGPFHGPMRVRDVVREVADTLELRNCAGSTPVRFADQLDLFTWERSPLCLRADVKRCLAPCAARCTRTEYGERVATARNFLNGDTDMPLAILRARMDTAARALNFEYAALLRDRLDRLETARQELLILRGIIESLSFVYQPPAWEGAPRVYLIRRGVVHEDCAAPRNEDERARVLERARALFRPRRHPTAVRPTQAAEILLLARWFRLRPGELDNVWDSPAPGARSRLAVLRALG